VVLSALAPLALPSRTSPLPGATGKPLHLGVPAIQLGLSLTVLTAAALLDRAAGRLVTSGGPTSDVGELYQITAAPVPPAKRAAHPRRRRAERLVPGGRRRRGPAAGRIRRGAATVGRGLPERVAASGAHGGPPGAGAP